MTGLCPQSDICFLVGGEERGRVARVEASPPSRPCINCHGGSHSKANQSDQPPGSSLASTPLPFLRWTPSVSSGTRQLQSPHALPLPAPSQKRVPLGALLCLRGCGAGPGPPGCHCFLCLSPAVGGILCVAVLRILIF